MAMLSAGFNKLFPYCSASFSAERANFCHQPYRDQAWFPAIAARSGHPQAIARRYNCRKNNLQHGQSHLKAKESPQSVDYQLNHRVTETTMIVFNLSCSQSHTFDGWFRSAEDFGVQSEHGLVECPVCGDKEIIKRLSAPHINSGIGRKSAESAHATHNAAEESAAGEGESREVLPASMLPGLQQHMMQQFRQFVMSNTENVGNAFAETARRIHYGEESHRNIRGRVTPEDAESLREEGIDTVSLPPGVFFDEGLQ